MRHLKVLTSVALLLLLGISCSENPVDNSPREDPRELEEQQIVAMYYSWARYSRQHNYSAMLALCYPGSSFEGGTNVSKEQWDAGSEFYHTFDSVEILYWEDDGTPYVVGNTRVNQGANVPEFYNGFASGCRKLNGEWRLDGINSNAEPDWWK